MGISASHWANMVASAQADARMLYPNDPDAQAIYIDDRLCIATEEGSAARRRKNAHEELKQGRFQFRTSTGPRWRRILWRIYYAFSP